MQVMSRQRGVSLIEVLVAVIVFSIGILGLAMLQIKGAQYTKDSAMRTYAVVMTRSLADAMRANLAGVYGVDTTSSISAKNGDLSGSYYLYSGTGTVDSTSCSGACSMAKQDLSNWLSQLKLSMATPSGSGAMAKVTVGSTTGSLIITVAWDSLKSSDVVSSSNTNTTSTNESYSFSFQP